MRVGKKASKKYRVAGKKGKGGKMPSADEMKAGMTEAQEMAALQKKRGFKRRRKMRKG